MVLGNGGDSSQKVSESVTPEKVDVDYQAESSFDAKQLFGASEQLKQTSCTLQKHVLAPTLGSSSKPDPSESVGQSDDKNCWAKNTHEPESPNVDEDNQRQECENTKYVVVDEKILNFKLIPIRKKPVMTYGLDFEEVNEQCPEDITKGWRVETRQRSNGTKDHFYYHPTTTQLRSLDEVKMHIKRHYNPQNMEQLDHKSNEGFQAYHLVKLPKKFPPNGKRKNNSSPGKPKQKNSKSSRMELEETSEINMSVPPTQIADRFNKRDVEDFAVEPLKNQLIDSNNGQIQAVRSSSHDSGNPSNEDMLWDMLKEVNEHFESAFENLEASVSEVKINEYMKMLAGLLSTTNE